MSANDIGAAVGVDGEATPVAATQAVPVVGDLVRVEFGRREQTGLVTAVTASSEMAPEKIKNALGRIALPVPLSAQWIALCQFAASYYHRPLGEVMLPALPKNLRSASPVALRRALAAVMPEIAPPKKQRQRKSSGGGVDVDAAMPEMIATAEAAIVRAALPVLNLQQQHAVDEVVGRADQFGTFLLHGVTGSGKTEVYMQMIEQILAHSQASGVAAQALILVPEINLTPQFEQHLRARFPDRDVVTLHSGLAEGERMRSWLSGHMGRASIMLGTRLAVLASLPNLKLIVVDEEHDASYKQQEGLRYSARDLAIWRGHQLGIPVVLGSATPSLESWYHAGAASRRYQLLSLNQRAVPNAVLPQVRLIDTSREKVEHGLTRTLINALALRLERGEQSLLFLNRRGYAPVLSCDACGWLSDCPRCSAFMVLHSAEKKLRCHHCSFERAIPRACPTCGNLDLQPLGRGTQRLEESLQQMFPQARLLRIDADSTRLKGSAQQAFDQVHAGQVDILIGTQMVAKGHDFHNLTLVGIVNPDTALFSQDYRASERLFQQLMQVAGRAGRHSTEAGQSEVLIQTRYPGHPLYDAVIGHDYARFAKGVLEEREQAALVPFAFQALLRAQGREMADVLAFLKQVTDNYGPTDGSIVMQDPIPMTVARVASQDRAQMLIESASRPALQHYLGMLNQALSAQRPGKGIKWSLEVDPHDI